MFGIPRTLFRSAIALFAMLAGSALVPSTALADDFVGFITQPPDGGIIVVGGDPIYSLRFDGFLATGYQMIGGLDGIVIQKVPGVTDATHPSPFISKPEQGSGLLPLGMGWSPSISPNGTGPWLSNPPITVDLNNLNFAYTHDTFDPHPSTPITNTSGSNLYLGQFAIQTLDLPALVAGTTIALTYTMYAHNLSTGLRESTTGTVTLSMVPEPSSIVMLGLGAAGAVGWTVRRRRAAAV